VWPAPPCPACRSRTAPRHGRRRWQRLARVARQALDRRQFTAAAIDREQQAGVDRGAVDEDRAGAAFAFAAAIFGAGQADHVAQQLQRAQADVDAGALLDTVEPEADFMLE
jgi:hypothetical protein